MRPLNIPTNYFTANLGAAEIDMGTLRIAQQDVSGCDRAAFYDRGDPKQRHLYALRLVWKWQLGVALVIGRSPGTADEFRDDPTTKQLRRFVERSGCGALYMVNVYALRTARLHKLRRAYTADACDAIGPLNSPLLWREMASSCSLVIGAWGSDLVKQSHHNDAAQAGGSTLQCWGTDAGGAPNRVAKLSLATPLVPFDPRANYRSKHGGRRCSKG